MKHNSSLCRVTLVALAFLVAFPLRMDAQEDVLGSSNPDLQALVSQRKALLMSSIGPFPGLIDKVTSADAQALGILDAASSSAEGDLRASIDLLLVYENLQCEPDRTMMRPLLVDRLHLYSRLLNFAAERAVLPLGPPSIVTQPDTAKRALKLHDDVLVAKSKLDEITRSLK
jgi:hypothetical protein